MNKTAIAFLSMSAALLLTGCMSEMEYKLRKDDLKAKSSWPATYQSIKIKGPLTLDRDSEMIVTVPNMPYQHTPIPDGQAIQASLAKDAIHTGAMLGGAIYSIHKANGSTHNTTNNYAGGTAE